MVGSENIEWPLTGMFYFKWPLPFLRSIRPLLI